MNRIGIMQGRLIPDPGAPLQAFPVQGWRQELAELRSAGLDGIEWVVTEYGLEENPVWNDAGVAQARRLAADQGVAIFSLCFDWFQQAPTFRGTAGEARRRRERLFRCVAAAAGLGARAFLIPLLGQAVPADPVEESAWVDCLSALTVPLRETGLLLLIESDPGADRTADWMRRAGVVHWGEVCDLGNWTAAGLDPVKGIAAAGGRLGEIHLKDRRPGGPNVPLGAGAVDFSACFEQLVRSGFSGPMILETPPGIEPIRSAGQFREFVERHWPCLK